MRIQELWPALVAAWLAILACVGAAAMPIPQKPITLDTAEMARLRAAIALPRPDVLVTVTGVYVNDLAGAPPGAPRATFETDAFDTGSGHRRHRLGWCELAPSAQWTCSYRDRLTRVIGDMTITAVLPTGMSTELAVRILEFAVPLINVGTRSEREFSVSEYGDHIWVSFGSGCSTSLEFRRQGETFENLTLKSPQGGVCH